MSLTSLCWTRLPDNKEVFDAHSTVGDIKRSLEILSSSHSDKSLERSVYILRIRSQFVIRYPRFGSPVLYIGEGNFLQRMGSHKRNWLQAFAKEQKDFCYSIWFCVPRVRNNEDAYKSVEGHLIQWFKKKYGAIPLYNSHTEKEIKKYKYDKSFYQALMIGKGSRPKWSITPCRSHPAHKKYFKGFDWEQEMRIF